MFGGVACCCWLLHFLRPSNTRTNRVVGTVFFWRQERGAKKMHRAPVGAGVHAVLCCAVEISVKRYTHVFRRFPCMDRWCISLGGWLD